jgi:2-polyprenyl-3-methyl-5-hydroxy-6-metoxy-1,4-benzoquinol methylase
MPMLEMNYTFKRWNHRILVAKRMLSNKINRISGPRDIKIQPKKLYEIKKGYHHALRVEQFDDTPNKDEWQRSVYEKTAMIGQEFQYNTIIDVGCGSGYKLINMFKHYKTIGIELKDTYNWLIKQYPTNKWLVFEDTDPSLLKSDLVICSDVIEHICDPDTLMAFLQLISFKYLIISTPERDSVRGNHDFGPPINTSHYREWNKAEFGRYVSQWFSVRDHFVLEDNSITQLIVCTPRLV